MSSLIYFGNFAKYVCCLSYHVGVFGIPKIGGAAVRDPVLLQGLFDGKTWLFHRWVNMPNLVFVAQNVRVRRGLPKIWERLGPAKI